MIEDEPRIYWSKKQKAWLTATDVQWFDKHSAVTILVPAGFRTDLASVPKVLHPIVSPAGCWNKASIVHDFLYYMRGRLPGGKKLTRKECDRIFLDIAIIDGTNPFVATIGYYGIRANPWNWPLFKIW